MRLYRYFSIVIIGLCLSFTASANVPTEEAARLLPDKIGNYIAVGIAGPVSDSTGHPEDYKITAAAARKYRNANGVSIFVNLWRTASDNAAYSMLQQTQAVTRFSEAKEQLTFGTQGRGFANEKGLKCVVEFFQGPAFVTLSTASSFDELTDFGQKIAATLDKGEGEIPSLVKHLPDWGKIQNNVLYAVTPAALNGYADNAPVLAAASFEGGAEAVVARYGNAQMVIVEFTTPQLATANDAAIQAKIKELQAAGQNAQTAYKREGNYGVFVFNAPDEATAQQLISQVKYEKTVQWLGENPNILIRAQKRYVAIASGVFVSVMKVSGIAALLTLGLGGLFGALVFRRRRAQDLAASAYTDAGGMMRLNLDEMTPEMNPARLLETNKS